MIHAADLANLLILAAERGKRLPAPGDTSAPRGQGYYFAACETDLSYADLGRKISLLIGRRSVAAIHTNPAFIWMLAAMGELTGQVLRKPQFLNLDKAWEITAGSWCCSAQAAINDLGFCVAAPLSERLLETAKWYHREGWLKAGRGCRSL